jgi:ABC-type nitrate/sulfonate/bicarbonate transport system substrate-binding protein
MIHLLALLLAVAAAAPGAVPALTVAYRYDGNAAPLIDACTYPEDFRSRYGLYLDETTARQLYSLYDGKNRTLSVRLTGFDSDSQVLATLLSGEAQVGILRSEAVLAAVIEGKPVRIIAPLQYRGDRLVVRDSVPAADWNEFRAWVKIQVRPISVGYIEPRSTAVLGFTQALEYENLRFEDAALGVPAGKESRKVRLVPVDDRNPPCGIQAELQDGRLDAVVLSEPTAAWVGALPGCRDIGRIDNLPPGRFEDCPGTVIAATDSAIRRQGEAVGRFLELMGVATHYANNRTHNTLAAANKWLQTPPALESTALGNVRFSSRPDFNFTTGIWNWYFALRLRKALPDSLAGYMEQKEWLGVPYDSLLLMPALDRAGARIIR